MTSQGTWRPVLCVVDKSIGWRVPVGVLVERPDGLTEWYGRRLHVEELGGPARLKQAQQDVIDIAVRGLLAGPLRRCVFGTVNWLPDDLNPIDTAAWLREHWSEP